MVPQRVGNTPSATKCPCSETKELWQWPPVDETSNAADLAILVAVVAPALTRTPQAGRIAFGIKARTVVQQAQSKGAKVERWTAPNARDVTAEAAGLSGQSAFANVEPLTTEVKLKNRQRAR
jgi:hypothetical protein